jgi:iron complex transport system substrate-binding protein
MDIRLPRIVSLLPSSTEIVCSLGLESALVGISHECDYPASIRHLPVCTAPKFNPHVSSREIDQSVKLLLKDGLSVYEVNTELLDTLHPNFIITQSQCELCAVSFNDVQRAVCQMIRSQPVIINLEPNELADIFTDIQRIADALSVSERGKIFIQQCKNKIDNLQIRIHKNKLTNLNKRVITIEWLDPLMNAGNWIPEMIHLAGGINCMGQSGEHSHYMQWDEIVSADPDCIVVMPCGFSVDRAMQEIHLLTSQPGYSQLRAVQTHQVYVTDGNSYFNRPSPRIVDGIEMLAEIFHPGFFPARYVDTYVRLHAPLLV